MLQVTVKLIFNISLGLSFSLILISCMVVLVVFCSHESSWPCRNLLLGCLKTSSCDPTLISSLEKKAPLTKNDTWLSPPTIIPAKMRFKTAAENCQEPALSLLCKCMTWLPGLFENLQWLKEGFKSQFVLSYLKNESKLAYSLVSWHDSPWMMLTNRNRVKAKSEHSDKKGNQLAHFANK